jgi:hypothetical protein
MDISERTAKIQGRAYRRWIEHGGSDPIADWLAAERELDAESEKTDVGPAKSTRYLGVHHPDGLDIENPT